MWSNLSAKCFCGRCGRYKFPRCEGSSQETRAHIVTTETLQAHEVPEDTLSSYSVEEPKEDNVVEHEEQMNSTVTIDNKEPSTNVDFDIIPCTTQSSTGNSNKGTTPRRGRKRTVKVDRDVSAQTIGKRKTRSATAIDAKNIADNFQLQCPSDDSKKVCEAQHTASRPLPSGVAKRKHESAKTNSQTRTYRKPRNAPRAPRGANKKKEAQPVESHLDFNITCVESKTIRDTNGIQLGSHVTKSVMGGSTTLVGTKAKNLELTSQNFCLKVEVESSEDGKESGHN